MKNGRLLLGTVSLAAIAGTIIFSPFTGENLPTYKARTSDEAPTNANDAFELYKQMRSVNGVYDPEYLKQVRQQALFDIEHQKKDSRALNMAWIEEGPDNVGGRTRAILIDRNYSQHVFAGSVTGGLFESWNGGNNWFPNGGFNNITGSLAVSTMCMTNDNTMYLGTGFNGYFQEGGPSDGLYVSTDFGATWSPVTGISSTQAILELQADPIVQDRIWIAGENSLKTYTPSGGLQNVALSGSVTRVMDVKVSPDGLLIVANCYASGAYQTQVSTNGGTSFTVVSGSGTTQIPQSNVTRIEYALSFDKNSNGYWNILGSVINSGAGYGELKGIYISEDHGATWSLIAPGGGSFDPFVSGSGNFVSPQGVYDNVCSGVPGYPDRFLIGGIDLYEWNKQPGLVPTYGQFEQKSFWFLSPPIPTFVHADNHEMEWDENEFLYVGNDGGVFKSPDKGSIFFQANRGYNVTQFYSVAFSADGDVMGGSQDNGTNLNTHTGFTWQSFEEVRGGDGFDCDISHMNEDVLIGSVYYGDMRRSDDGGNSWSYVMDTLDKLGNPGQDLGPFQTIGRLYENENDVNALDSVLWINTLEGPVILDTANGSTTLFTGTIIGTGTNKQIEPNTVIIKIGSNSIIDNGSGALTGAILSSNGTINYTTGAYSFTTTTAPSANSTIVADEYGIRYNVGAVINYQSQTFQTPLTYTITSVLNSGDTIALQDPIQSLYCLPLSGSLGIWVTREVLRFSADPYAINIQQEATWIFPYTPSSVSGSATAAEFSKDGNHLYVAAGGDVFRFSGLNTMYAPNYDVSGLTAVQIYVSSNYVSGIAVDPNDENHVIICAGGALVESNVAATTTTTTSFGSIRGNLTSGLEVFDGIIDLNDNGKCVIGTEMGLYATDNINGGSTQWTYQVSGPGLVPVYAVRQQQRTWAEGAFKSGEVYAGTFGRGIWRSEGLLAIGNSIPAESTGIISNILVMPNPMTDFGQVTFELNERSDVKIQLFNLQGKIVKTMSLGEMSEGKQKAALDVSELSTGTYIVNVVAGEKMYQTKLVVTK